MESGPGGNNPPNPHVHSSGCGCSEEMKMQDPNGMDLFELIDFSGVMCFNERRENSVKNVIRMFDNKFDFSKGPLKSGSGKDMVIVIPFTCEVRVKCIALVGGDDGESPQTMKCYKNEEVVDIDIQEDKKPVQQFDLN